MSIYQSSTRDNPADCEDCGSPLAGDNDKGICFQCQRIRHHAQAALVARVDTLTETERRLWVNQYQLIKENAKLYARLDAFELRFPATVRSANATLDALERQQVTNTGRIKLHEGEIDGVAGVVKRNLSPRLDALAEQVAELTRVMTRVERRAQHVENRLNNHVLACAKEFGSLVERMAELGARLAESKALDEDGKVHRSEFVYLYTGDAKPPEHTCEACGLPEDGLKVRNVTIRPPSRLHLCADCAQVEIPF